MDATRANELPLEQHGPDASKADSVKDWQSDRLAVMLTSLKDQLQAAIDAREAKGLHTEQLPGLAYMGLQTLESVAKNPTERNQLADFLDKELVSSVPRHAEAIQAGTYGKEDFFKEPGIPLAMAAYGASSTASLPQYMGLSAGACAPGSDLEHICDRASALISKGYIGEAELGKLKIAVLDSDAIRERASSALYDVSRAAGLPDALPRQENRGESEFDIKSDQIVVSKQQSVQHMFPGHAPDKAVVDVFSHELGHFLAKDNLLATVAKGVEAIEQQGGKEGELARQFINPPDKYVQPGSHPVYFFEDSTGASGILGRQLGLEAKPWASAAGEMYGDLMAVAAEKAQYGSKAGIDFANELAAQRDAHSADFLQGVQKGAPTLAEHRREAPLYGETHHTTAALDHFRDAIKEGRLDAVHTPQQLNALIGESIAKGLIQEYAHIRTAELNLHHEQGGKMVPGLPEGVASSALLLGELKNQINPMPGAAKFVVSAEQYDKLPLEAQMGAIAIKNEQGEKQTLHISSQAPDGVGTESVKKNGIADLQSSARESAEKHLSQLPSDMRQAPAVAEQKAARAESAQASAAQAEMAH